MFKELSTKRGVEAVDAKAPGYKYGRDKGSWKVQKGSWPRLDKKKDDCIAKGEEMDRKWIEKE